LFTTITLNWLLPDVLEVKHPPVFKTAAKVWFFFSHLQLHLK